MLRTGSWTRHAACRCVHGTVTLAFKMLHPGEIVPLELEIWPSATLFEPGTSLQLTIQGQDAARYPAFGHRNFVNRGWHTISTGGTYSSCLTVPLNNPSLWR
ncbi:MAG: hypothetical protein JO151_02150 [Verrucomicrobia bacterium]|nr:hypothetical protein [Verrucomicrobiota bacterium]